MIIFVNKFQKHISGYFNRYNFVNVKIIQNKIELTGYINKYNFEKNSLMLKIKNCGNGLTEILLLRRKCFASLV